MKFKNAAYGEKTLEVKVRFWTSDIVPGKGAYKKKHAKTSGMVYMDKNESRGIEPGPSRDFHSLMGLPKAIEELFIDHGITLHPGPVMKKYISPKPALR